MSVLENRLRLGRRQCRQWRRYLAGLESLAQRLGADGPRLRAGIERAVAGRPDFAGEPDGQPAGEVAGDLARELTERHGKLARSVAAIDTQIAEVGAALGAAEQELRRQELAAVPRSARAGLSEPRRTRRASAAKAP
jgi:hypothetical protein